MSYVKTSSCQPPASITLNRTTPFLNSRGFTLVELIVVVLILGIVTILAIPAYSDVKRMARNAKAITELREMEKVIIAYAIEKNGTYPPSLVQVNLNGRMDPWGNPYEYSPVLHRTDVFVELVNEREDGQPSFDLYSKGQDGQTANSIDAPLGADDIFRAGDGSFVGTKESYYLD